MERQWEVWPNHTSREITVGALETHSNLVSAAAVVPYTDFAGGMSRARLIAAAPEMLEALKNLVEYAAMVAAENDERPITLSAARAAIAKAEGDA